MKRFITSLLMTMFLAPCSYNFCDARDNYIFSNTNIGKAAFSINGGLGYAPYSGSLSEYFKPGIGGTMSICYYTYNHMAYSLALSGTSGLFKKNISEMWQKGDSVSFSLINLAVGYSLVNHVHWRLTPFCGLAFSSSDPYSTKRFSDTRQFRTRLAPTPSIGINITYKFINPNKHRDIDRLSSCSAINAQINYVQFAVYDKKLPYHGGIWYLTIGYSMEIFKIHGQ